MASFARRVILYQLRHGRHDLPWQRRRTPYRIWISEIMLQQTRVTTVVPYFRQFMRTFPSVKRLAEAPLDAVLACWSGLGYYARARHLHQAAQIIRGEGGRLPRSIEDWTRLPGVGRSTAGAIVSLALDQPAPMLDGNARRVIARHQGLSATASASLWRAAERLLPERDAALYTQGLMDLGSQCCGPRIPDCARCPLNEDCDYAIHGPGEQPDRERPRLPHRTAWVVIAQKENGKVLLRRRDVHGIWGGLWSLPEYPSRSAARAWTRTCGENLEWREEPLLTHRLSHLELRLRPLRVWIRDAERPELQKDGRWFDPKQLTVGVAAPIMRLIQRDPLPENPKRREESTIIMSPDADSNLRGN